jgi:chromosome segregation ATPase
VNAAELFPKPSSDAAKGLLKLASRHDELRAEARDLNAQGAAGSAAKAEASKRLRAAEARDHAFGDAKAEVKSAKGELAKLEKAAGALAEKSRIVRDATSTVEAELRRYAAEHADALWKELAQDNRQAAERLVAALGEVHEAHADYGQAGARAAELLRLVAPDRARNERVAEAPAEVGQFAKRAPEYAGAIRVPLPGLPGHEVVKAEPAPSDSPVTFEVVGG